MHVRPIDPKTADITIKFLLEDPEGLTGKTDPTVTIKAHEGMHILEAAMASGIMIEHACGGVCACSTCHIYLEQGAEHVTESTEAEEDRVEEAPGLQRNSRLSCQCVLKASAATSGAVIQVRVPSWNRNAVKEGAH